MITKDTYIEELIDEIPESIGYFLNHGISLLICGEPAWGTINEICTAKGFSIDRIENIVEEINNLKSKN